MSISTFKRVASGSLLRSLWNRDRSAARRRKPRTTLAPALDQLESRLALSITTPLSIGGTTVGSFLDAPTGPGSVSDFVTVAIEGTRGTVVFNGGAGIIDGNDIQTIDIFDASPDFQVTFTATVGTANAVPYGSDGVIQMGTITATNVIRGINTVRGPLTNTAPTTGVAAPIGFTQSTAGSNTLFLEGDQTGTFAVNTYVCATPLLSEGTVGSPSFGTVTSVAFDAPTNITTLVFDNTTATGTTAGALTLAERVQPYFELTTFTGVNFSNRNLKDGGGIFVDRVVGADTTVNGDFYPDLGILLSQGLLAYSTIGIRDVLDAGIVLGTTRSSSTDGRLLIESATNDGEGDGSYIFVGPRGTVSKNSKLQILGGAGEFGANVSVFQNFDGVVNLGGAASGSFQFLRNVGSAAVLNADDWNSVAVEGNFAGSINAVDDGGDVSLAVAGNLAATARINAEDALSLDVGRGVLKGATIAAGDDVSLNIAGNFAGSLASGGNVSGDIDGDLTGATIAASSDISLDIGGSIVNSALSAYSGNTLDVAGSIRNSRFFANSDDMSIDVAGNVTNSGFNVGYDYDLILAARNVSGSNFQSASGDIEVDVADNVTSSTFTATYSDVTVEVGGDFIKSRIVTGDNATLSVGRDALSSTVLGDDDVSLDIGRNWRGVAQSASSDLLLDVGGSVLRGSSFMSGEDTRIDVDGNFDGSTTSRNLRYFVGGNVSKASRIVAQRVTDWQSTGGANFGIGGRFDGILNVGVFDGFQNEAATVTVIGNGAGKGARFYVDRFETDTLVFNGNFQGNLRVLQDLTANLDFAGNVDRITIGGRVGSYIPGNEITVSPATINVTGRLLYLNTNSFFQALNPGVSGLFWSDATSTDPLMATGALTTGRYITVVPNRQTVTPPGPLPPQQYSVPGVPAGYSASLNGSDDGINVTFEAPTSSGSLPGDGNLPVLYYEYTTNAADGTPTWTRFLNAAQGPGTDIALPGVSTGGPFIPGDTYNVSVRAVNALGAGLGTAPTAITIPNV